MADGHYEEHAADGRGQDNRGVTGPASLASPPRCSPERQEPLAAHGANGVTGQIYGQDLVPPSESTGTFSRYGHAHSAARPDSGYTGTFRRTRGRKAFRMPNKRANVKNEKQYEALKDKGMVVGARGVDRELLRRLEPRRQELPLGKLQEHLLAGRNDGSEESRRPQGREGRRSKELRGSSLGRPGVLRASHSLGRWTRPE
jgi:hypothetical protein